MQSYNPTVISVVYEEGDAKWPTVHNIIKKHVVGAKCASGTANHNKMFFPKDQKMKRGNIQGLIQHPGKLHISEEGNGTHTLREVCWRAPIHFPSVSSKGYENECKIPSH